MQPTAPSPQPDPAPAFDPRRYQETLGATLAADEFSADAIKRRLEATTADRTPAVGPLDKTRTDLVSPPDTPPLLQAPSLATRAPGRFSDTIPAVTRYELHDLIGAGAWGEVYRATDVNLGREVAVKVLRVLPAGGRERDQRFVREARVTAQLEHPSILPVYELDLTDDGRLYFAMRLAAGHSLGRLIRAAADGDIATEIRSIVDRLNIFLKICDAVAYAHHKGIVHQDIKPDNVVIGRFGEVVLVDWGTAEFASELASGQGRIVGTPAYMSPEQARRERADQRSDIYCLGATFFHLLTLRYPTWSEDPDEFWELKRAGTINADLRSLPPDVPSGLVEIARRAMAPLPADRYQSVQELQEAIREYQTHADSIGIVERCRAALAEAEQSGSYEQFARVVADLEQALRLWPGNRAATGLLRETRLTYATVALERGDLTLAADTAALIPDEQELAQRIADAQASAGRRRRQSQTARLAAVTMTLAFTAAVAYLGVDHYQRFGRWRQVFHRAFVGPGAGLEGLAFSHTQLDRNDTVPALHPLGLRLEQGQMVWVEDTREAGNVRLEVRLRWKERVDGVEMMINTRREHPTNFWLCPAGYSSQFGGFVGHTTFISRNDVAQAPRQAGGVYVPFQPGRLYRLWFQRTGEELALYVNGRRVYRQIEPLPMAGEGLDRIAVRSWASRVELLSLTVYRLGSPAKPRPVIAGDALVRRGLYAEAAEEYLRIAADHTGSSTAEEALVRAYLLAPLLPPGRKDTVQTAARAVLHARHPDSRYWPRLLDADCMDAWRWGQYEQALTMAKELLRRDPDSRIALQLLAARRRDLAPEIVHSLLALVGRTTRVRHLDISDMGIVDLSPLGNLRLTYLDCRYNRISSLDPLAGMPLQLLNCTGNRISSLTPLAGMPLRVLYCSNNKISDLSPLTGMPLTTLDFEENSVSDLGPLSGMRPEQLHCGFNLISDLRPLAGMPLKELQCQSNRIEDLRPLAGMPLRELNCFGNRIASLDGLQGMPLEVLNCSQNPLTTLAGLAGLPLRVLDCSFNRLTSLHGIEDAPLTQLICDSNPIADLEPLRGKRLSKLECNMALVRSLEPLRGMPLEDIGVDWNGIQDLNPLRGAPLRWLSCFGNPLRSLAPFERTPPSDLFLFSCASLRPGYVDSVFRTWEQNGDTTVLRQAELVRALERADRRTLLERASVYEGRRYLFVRLVLQWPMADSLSRTVGGHLLTVGSAEEQEFVFSLLKKAGDLGSWLGLRPGPNGMEWVTGEPLVFTSFAAERFRHGANYLQILVRSPASWLEVSTNEARSTFILEWEL